MKIIVRIRRRDNKRLVMEVDSKLENNDTPQVHAYGLKLLRALVGEEEQQ